MRRRKHVQKSPGTLVLKEAAIWVDGTGYIRIKLNGKVRSTAPPIPSVKRQAHLYAALQKMLVDEGLWLDSLRGFGPRKRPERS